ncbi:Protein TONSOKU [Linum perenne]
MARDDGRLSTAKRAYKTAQEEGNRQDEARWANVIGDILKNRGEYVEALRWLRKDYDVSVRYLPEKDLLATCQSIGELYLRLENFSDALVYQKKHFELANSANDLAEQQRASTQLGRLYHAMFLRSDDDCYAVKNAKKYFKLAMKLAETLKGNPPTNKSSFLKEYIDAHNNIGMLEFDLDNLEVAKDILIKGLQICDEEEVDENDDARSRLHHNLGNCYMELRKWDKAREHIEKDIVICQKIAQCQGEAKGFINLGELHSRVQKYDDAVLCYQRALGLAKSMEDEDALVKQIEANIITVREAMKVVDDLKVEEQNLKKLTRDMASVRGTAHERKYLLKLYTLLDHLIEKSSSISAWLKHLEFAKQKKKVATQLCDKVKLNDSYLVLGESYQKIRDFNKAYKCFSKAWEGYKVIGCLEGQALAKINIGDVLDCRGDWSGALASFEEGYRIAMEANVPSAQLQALENMHYSQMIRFQNADEARSLQHEIEKLKQLKGKEAEKKYLATDHCSETDTEEGDCLSDSSFTKSCCPNSGDSFPRRSTSSSSIEEVNDDLPLISLLKSTKRLTKKTDTNGKKLHGSNNPNEASPNCFAKTTTSQQSVGRKRVRVILSDDEDETNEEVAHLERKLRTTPVEDVATSDQTGMRNIRACSSSEIRDLSMDGSKYATDSSKQVKDDHGSFLYKSPSPNGVTHANQTLRSVSRGEMIFGCDSATSGSVCGLGASDNHLHELDAANFNLNDSGDNNKRGITFNIASDQISFEAGSSFTFSGLSIESLSVEVACLYYLQLPTEKRCKGLLPIIQHLKHDGQILDSLDELEALNNDAGNAFIEVSINGWTQKRLMKLYIDCCTELNETPNMNLLKKLYVSEVEDEVIASECGLQDISIAPLLNSLQTHKTVLMLDLSHNLLGNGTMEKLQQFFTTGQKYGDLSLDLHCNRFGPTALFQICECPVLFSRLEVLNISGNRLTDACGSYLSTILEKCRALYSLNIERCSITSRTIQKVADAIHSGSLLAQLSIGYNPLSGASIINLLTKLSTLNSFTELNLSGLKLNKPVIDSLCKLTKTFSLTNLTVGSTGIGNEGALLLTDSLSSGSEESLKLDLSYCNLTSTFVQTLTTNFSLVSCILELNLEGNPILPEGGSALVSLLKQPGCSLRLLILNKCQLGLPLILQLLQALAENNQLEELHVAENDDLQKFRQTPTTTSHSTAADHEGSLPDCQVNMEYDCLEVLDSYDSARIEAEAAARLQSELNDTCTSSSGKNKNEDNELSTMENLIIKELSDAIGAAKALQMLDLSRNGMCVKEVEALYASWRRGKGSAQKHVKDQIVHFSVAGKKCCRKPCCRRE